MKPNPIRAARVDRDDTPELEALMQGLSFCWLVFGNRAAAKVQKRYLDYLSASYAAIVASRPELEMADEEWRDINGGVPPWALERVIKPKALKVEVWV